MAKIIPLFTVQPERAPLEAMLPGLAMGALIWVTVIWLFI